MGRIIVPVKIENASDPAKCFGCDGLVDTGASFMVLPNAWRDRLGPLRRVAEVEVEVATQDTVSGDICGPVLIQMEGFRPVYTEVLFVDMRPSDGQYEPLIGYTVLELSQAAVDMIGHRLVHLKHVDMKKM